MNALSQALKADGRMDASIRTMVTEISGTLGGQARCIWLYGSAVMDDFRPGWSDLDFIAYFDGSLTDAQADHLLTLRQFLSGAYPENPYFACFEGAIVPFPDDGAAFADGRGVYWGTTG